MSQFICKIFKICRLKLLQKLKFWHKNLFTFSAKYLAHIAFPEFFRRMSSTQRSLMVIFWWSIKAKLFLCFYCFYMFSLFFFSSLIWVTSLEDLVDGKIELTYTLLCYNFDNFAPTSIIFFGRCFSSDVSFLWRMFLIPAWIIAQS